MLSEMATTILGTLGAGITFVLMAAGSGQIEVQPGWIVGLGAAGAMITFLLGKTHPGRQA